MSAAHADEEECWHFLSLSPPRSHPSVHLVALKCMLYRMKRRALGHISRVKHFRVLLSLARSFRSVIDFARCNIH